jgi:two-component system response regulator NreC
MRVLLVDSQRLFRESLCALLRTQDGFEVVGQAGSAREAYELVRRQHPDLVVTELLLPGVDGIAATREIQRLRRECKVLVVTACKESHRLQTAWLSGIDACVTKDESADTLLAAIRALAAGRRFLSAVVRKTGSELEAVEDSNPRRGNLAQLSPREREVFDLVVRGFSTKEVAGELCISIKTVETHRTHINEKLVAHCSADLVRYAFRHGLSPSLTASLESEPLGANGKSNPGKSPQPRS